MPYRKRTRRIRPELLIGVIVLAELLVAIIAAFASLR